MVPCVLAFSARALRVRGNKNERPHASDTKGKSARQIGQSHLGKPNQIASTAGLAYFHMALTCALTNKTHM